VTLHRVGSRQRLHARPPQFRLSVARRAAREAISPARRSGTQRSARRRPGGKSDRLLEGDLGHERLVIVIAHTRVETVQPLARASSARRPIASTSVSPTLAWRRQQEDKVGAVRVCQHLLDAQLQPAAQCRLPRLDLVQRTLDNAG